MKTISKKRAIQLCCNWYRGQHDKLYQYLSSGVFMPENILLYLNSIYAEIDGEYWHVNYYRPQYQYNELYMLKRYFEKLAFKWGITIEYKKHPDYGFTVPTIKENNSGIEIKELKFAR